MLFVAFVAFLLAGYIQGGGTWRGYYNLRKSLPAKGATVGMQRGRYGCDGCYVFVKENPPVEAAGLIRIAVWSLDRPRLDRPRSARGYFRRR